MIYFEGREYVSFDTLDILKGNITLNNKYGGSFGTIFAISPIDYREKYPTKAKFEVNKKDNEIIIYITNDYGKINVIKITNESIKDPVLIEAIKKFEQHDS